MRGGLSLRWDVRSLPRCTPYTLVLGAAFSLFLSLGALCKFSLFAVLLATSDSVR